MREIIGSFQGEYRFLSNFYPVTTGVLYKDVRFSTVEHAYQAVKAFISSGSSNIKILNAYATLPTPGLAKALGGTVQTTTEWSACRIAVMRDLVGQKFQEPVLRRLLLNTSSCDLVEGNTWGDTFWGVCDGVGDNNLGRVLMDLRTEI